MVRGEVPSRDVFRIVPEGGIGWNWGHGRTRPENLASHRGLMVLQKIVTHFSIQIPSVCWFSRDFFSAQRDLKRSQALK